MDIDRSINGWFKRISSIQKRADHYKLQQDILSSLSDKDGWDVCIKSKGLIFGAHTCILRCRCPRFYHEVIKKFDLSDLPLHLLERVSHFIKCLYSENDITSSENELIESVKAYYADKSQLSIIDTYKSKPISCDINRLYYSLSHVDDFSSSEFSDYEQNAYDDIESVIVNQAIIGRPNKRNMNVNLDALNKTCESQPNDANECSDSLVSKADSFLEDCLADCIIDASSLGDEIKLKASVKCETENDVLENTFNDTKIIIEPKVSSNFVAEKQNDLLDLTTNVQERKATQLVGQSLSDNNEGCNFNLDNNILVQNSDDIKNAINKDENTEKLSETTVDEFDVISPSNFETFTVIKKETDTKEPTLVENNNSHAQYNSKENSEILNEPLDFQTFTVVNQNNEIHDAETADYKTFTVVNTVSTPLSSPNEQRQESSLILLNNKTLSEDTKVLNTDTMCVIADAPSNFETLTLITPSIDRNTELKKDVVKELPVSKIENTMVIPPFKDKINHNKFLCEPDTCEKETSPSQRRDYQNDLQQTFTMSNDSVTPITNVELLKNTNSVNKETSNTNRKNLSGSENPSKQTKTQMESTGESDSTLSLHLDVIESNKKGLNSPDSLNDDNVFGKDEKPVVSNKLEFVPLGAELIKDNRSPRLSRKYMECSPVISANAYVPEEEKTNTVDENNSERKNSSSFFIDFNPGKPKNRPKRFESVTKSLDSSTTASNKEKIFSMFIDFNEDSESSESSSKGMKHRKPQTLADRFVRMHSEDASIKTNEPDNTVTPPPSRMTSTVDNSSVDITETCKKQSVFMFIENDMPAVVKRRSLPQSSRLKSQRNSWNVDSTVTHKTHQRTHSVNLSEDGQFDSRMTKSHIETGTKEINTPSDVFSVECSVSVTVNGTKDSGIGLVEQDSFVRLSDMDKAPSQEVINSLTRSETRPESTKRNLKNTELGRCLKRMFPYLKSTEIERILHSKSPKSLDSIEEVKSGLGRDLLRMFLEEIGADTTIDINGRRIRAHKCVLTSRCQYFAAMFSGGWVQSAGNVLYLKGFSYKTVHLTLRYIYSGECNFSEIKNVAELSKLADMLCLEGLKDNIMLYLAAEYCHFFKEVCDRCTIGILECLTLSVAYGLDDLYLSCIVWINDNFSVVWPSKHFVALPQDLKTKCFKHKVAHIDDLNDVLSVTKGCEKIKKTIPNDEWAKELIDLTTELSNSVIKYLAKNFYSTITSKYFKQILETENLFVDSFATHLLASCNCANRNQIRQAYDHLNKSLSNNFWHSQGEILVNAIMELIVKGLAGDFRTGRERQAIGSLPNDHRMSDALAKCIADELGVPETDIIPNSNLVTSSPAKKTVMTAKPVNKTPEVKTKIKLVENTPVAKPVKTTQKFAEVKSRYMEPKPQYTSPTPQKMLAIHKNLPRGRRINTSTSLTSSPNVRNTMPNVRLSTNRVDTGLKTKTPSEVSLTTPKTRPRMSLPKTDPPPTTRESNIVSRSTPRSTRRPVTNINIVNRKTSTCEKSMNSVKKQVIPPKTKTLPNGHPTIGSRSGTFCKDEPTVLHSKDITT
ncbi:uncharacterized protein LOC126843681 [Adelges cooleyi]|uniref:uncharacterized protein LOC126843681 n=1 Tax=Adelges cooleyi TaxID=133065 RepID=UPI002180702B|nr:uncharacterized protein LOC126843681 [Adelges cooleyi]